MNTHRRFAAAHSALLVLSLGASTVAQAALDTTPAWLADLDQTDSGFGYSVATAGDVNADGYSDVIVGAVWYTNGESSEGAAFVYLGTALGLSPTPAWSVEADQANTQMGISVAGAGDVNGDGFDDVIVGAWGYDNPESLEGRAFVYHGNATGVDATPAWTGESNQADAVFGESVAGAGDVNGDGFDDILVGSPQFENPTSNEGRVFLYLGAAGGLSATEAWTFESNQSNAQLGGSVAGAGDVNGDGYDDILIGAALYNDVYTNDGRAYLFHGSPTGPAATADWTAGGGKAAALFGISVATAGDVNGDGFADVIIGARDHDNTYTKEGRAAVYLGSATGLAASAAWNAYGGQQDSGYGASVCTAGDVNGDGFADVVVGSRSWAGTQVNEGRALVYLGSAAGVQPFQAWSYASGVLHAHLGGAVSGAGDVNGDGYSDVIVGAHMYSNGEPFEGAALTFHGGGGGLNPVAKWFADSYQAGANLGSAVGVAGDVNGDGYGDVVAGAPAFDGTGTDAGRAFVGYGRAGGTPSTWHMRDGVQANEMFATSVAGAGDVNNDGYSDVIIGAPGYDGTKIDEGRVVVHHGAPGGISMAPDWIATSGVDDARLGTSVAAAGDVNGDGFADVIVGAPGFTNENIDEGIAFVYLGSTDGLSPIPAWKVEGDQNGAALGTDVAGIGDVNGDGFSDIAVTAPGAKNTLAGEGIVFVFLGSPDGPSLTRDWAVSSGQIDAHLSRVAGAGDVNGDGYGDVVVAAPEFDTSSGDEGRVWVYHGSAGGLSATANWTTYGSQRLGRFGSAIATAGDVDADGFSDVVIGADGYTIAQTSDGAAFVHHGSPSGLDPTSAWTASGWVAGARFGTDVSTAGDMNGDGYADVIAGAAFYTGTLAGEGTIRLYLGNAEAVVSGLALRPRHVRSDGRPLDLLGMSDAGDRFRLAIDGRSPMGRGTVRLEAQVAVLGTAVDAAPPIIGPWTDTGTPGAEGSVAALDQLVASLTPGTVYHWRMRIRTGSRYTPFTPWLTRSPAAPTTTHVRTGGASVSVATSLPLLPGVLFEAARPNPFTTGTAIAFTMPSAGVATVEIFDVGGRHVATLLDRRIDAGDHSVAWDGRSASGTTVSPGVYLARVRAGGQASSGKIVAAR